MEDRAEMAKRLHVLADMVGCGCADVLRLDTHSAPLDRAIAAKLAVVSRPCLKTDHARDWDLRRDTCSRCGATPRPADIEPAQGWICNSCVAAL